MKKKVNFAFCCASIAVLSITGCTNSAKDSTETNTVLPPTANATTGSVFLKDASGSDKGTVTFSPIHSDAHGKDKVQVVVEVHGLTPGFHAVHIHSVGSCVPSTDLSKNFVSAGGHFQVAGHVTSPPSGELINIYADENGDGKSSFETDAFTLDQLSSTADGTSVVVHEKPSNFGNIPDRYVEAGKAGADDTSRRTSDAGDRLLCGIVAAKK